MSFDDPFGSETKARKRLAWLRHLIDLSEGCAQRVARKRPSLDLNFIQRAPRSAVASFFRCSRRQLRCCLQLDRTGDLPAAVVWSTGVPCRLVRSGAHRRTPRGGVVAASCSSHLLGPTGGKLLDTQEGSLRPLGVTVLPSCAGGPLIRPGTPPRPRSRPRRYGSLRRLARRRPRRGRHDAGPASSPRWRSATPPGGAGRHARAAGWRHEEAP